MYTHHMRLAQHVVIVATCVLIIMSLRLACPSRICPDGVGLTVCTTFTDNTYVQDIESLGPSHASIIQRFEHHHAA